MAQINKIINISFINLRGQTGFSIGKQLQIQQFILSHNIDICHLQESNIEEETFSSCAYITSNYEIIANNSVSKHWLSIRALAALALGLKIYTK